MTDLAADGLAATETMRNSIMGLRRMVAEANAERAEMQQLAQQWKRNAQHWEEHARQLETEVISSNEHRAFVRTILMLAVEALENDEGFYEALVDIRDMILPTEEERAAAYDAEATLIDDTRELGSGEPQ